MADPGTRKPRLPRNVHLVPVAEEIDRAVLPFLPQNGRPAVLHAHKVVLVVPPWQGAALVGSRVERALAEVTSVERHPVGGDSDHPAAGFQDLVQQLSWLCRRELAEGNRVHINLTSGSKLMAFAAGLVGMAHLRPGLGSVYHVQPTALSMSPEEYMTHGLTRGLGDVEELDLIPVLLPEPLQLRTLGFLRFRPEKAAPYRDVLRFLADVPGSGYSLPDAATPVRNWNNAVTTRMVRKVVGPLQAQGMVQVLERGREREVQITSQGMLYASIAGLEQPALKAPLNPVAGVDTLEQVGKRGERDVPRISR